MVPPLYADCEHSILSVFNFMIIFISGNIGSGKTTLAKMAAKKFNFFYFDADNLKPKIYSELKNFREMLNQGKPVPPSIRANLYKEMLKKLKIVSKKHNNVIVDETLYTQLGRSDLIKKSTQIFKRCAVILVTTKYKNTIRRLNMHRKGHMLTNPIALHNAMEKTKKPFKKYDLVLKNDLTISKSFKQLSLYINSLI